MLMAVACDTKSTPTTQFEMKKTEVRLRLLCATICRIPIRDDFIRAGAVFRNGCRWVGARNECLGWEGRAGDRGDSRWEVRCWWCVRVMCALQQELSAVRLEVGVDCDFKAHPENFGRHRQTVISDSKPCQSQH